MAEKRNLRNQIKCPMCTGSAFSRSWVGTIEFKGRDFDFMECSDCRSFVCDPMPEDDLLLEMYGSSYFDDGSCEFEDGSAGKFDDVVAYLRETEPGIFLDYGCGDGDLLNAVVALGWRPIGVEFNPAQVEALRGRYPFEIVNHTETPSCKADVLHLGDVLEHLTHLDHQFPQILTLLKPGGTLIAHGPLEANPNLFNFAMSLSRRFKASKITSVAPYHVILASTAGQRRLFDRHGLEEVDLLVTEVAFPAPERLTSEVLTRPRSAALYFIRKSSQLTTRLFGLKEHGNRYFYVGQNGVATDE